MSVCCVCGAKLTTANWYPSYREANRRICKLCRIKEVEAWQRKHPNRVRYKDPKYMTKYMRKYRKGNRKRVREIARLTFHRRDRELSTDTILNEHFEGAVLHHMTPSVAVYIPERLHRSVSHNLKTGRGMEEINAKATIWLRKGLLST